MVKNPVFHNRNKYINIKYHFIHEVEASILKVFISSIVR